MSTIKAIGGTLSQFGRKLAIGITGSSAIVNPTAEVNVPPIWEEANNTTGNVGNFQTSVFDGDFLIYRPYRIGTNGTYTVNEADVGNTFKLSERTFLSASDRNTGAELTLTLVSQSIISGSGGTYNTQEINLSDINVVFPDNATPGSTASFFIETSSNFEIHEDIVYEFEIQVKDQHGYISRVNKPSNSNHNSQHNLYSRLEITNTKESPFIITQSDSVSISSSTTPNNNISEMEFSLGNESSPDFTLIPTIYIKDRDRMDITDIKTNGDGIIPLTLYNLNFDSYVTTHSIGGDSLIFSSSNLVTNNETASARYFQLDLDPDQLPNKLSAKNSPYKLTISASDGTSTKTSSSITLNITNENPTWSSIQTSATSSIQNINNDTKKRATLQAYASASDPGGDNITLSEPTAMQINDGNKGFSANYFEIQKINEGTPTASYHIVTSSNFPSSFNDGEIKGNDIAFATVRASDECSPAGTTAAAGDNIGLLYLDAPPSWSATTQTIATNENGIGSTLAITNYKTVFDDTTHIGTTNAGDVTLDTGSGFTITCNDPRLLDSHFIFTPTNAVNGNNATFKVSTSSLYDRIDANATARLIVTASDNLNQTAHHTFQINITNIDEFVDVLGSDLLDELRSFIAPRVDGSTTQLGNTVADIESTVNGSRVNNISGSQGNNAYLSQSANFSFATVTSANGSTGLDFDTIRASVSAGTVVHYPLDILKTSGPGSLIMWLKTDARSNSGTENDTIFGHNNTTDGEFNLSSAGISSTDAALQLGGTDSITLSRYFDTGTTFSGRDYHQLAITWNNTVGGSTYNLYYNNGLIGSTTVFDTLTNGFRRAAFIGGLGRFNLDTLSQTHRVDLSLFMSFNKQLTLSNITTVYGAFKDAHGLS